MKKVVFLALFFVGNLVYERLVLFWSVVPTKIGILFRAKHFFVCGFISFFLPDWLAVGSVEHRTFMWEVVVRVSAEPTLRVLG